MVLCTWPVDPLIAAHRPQPPLPPARARRRQPHITQPRVPAPRLHLLLRLLPSLEVWLGEGLHGGEQAHFGHLPGEGDWLDGLALALLHDQTGQACTR